MFAFFLSAENFLRGKHYVVTLLLRGAVTKLYFEYHP